MKTLLKAGLQGGLTWAVLDALVMPDGSDDRAGAIYRVSYASAKT